MICDCLNICHSLCGMPIDTYVLRKVLEDFHVTTGRAVVDCTATFMKGPDYLNVPFAHPFVRDYFYLYLVTRDSHGYQSYTYGHIGFLSHLAAQLYMALVRLHLLQEIVSLWCCDGQKILTQALNALWCYFHISKLNRNQTRIQMYYYLVQCVSYGQ